jgi:hypothetical protein
MQQFGQIIRRMSGWVMLCLALATSACASDDTAPDYRYRLTVEVETPEGLKTGSSVIEVKQRLPGGKTLFALLRSDNNVDWASYVMQTLAPHLDSETFAQQLDNMLLLKGEIVLPRTFPPVGHLKERSAYPMLVTFGDLDDPTSVEEVDPDDLAATFGKGISLKRITVQMTDDPLTAGIERRLGWLEAHGRHHASLKPSGSRYLDEAQLINLVTHGDFSTELYR